MKTTKEKFKDEITIINKCCGKISFCNLKEHNKKVINDTVEVVFDLIDDKLEHTSEGSVIYSEEWEKIKQELLGDNQNFGGKKWYPEAEIGTYCLSKQRVREAINKLQFDDIAEGKLISAKELKKELFGGE